VLLGVVTTVLLSLDTTAVLLTSVVLSLAIQLELPALPFAMAVVWLANTARPSAAGVEPHQPARVRPARSQLRRVRRPDVGTRARRRGGHLSAARRALPPGAARRVPAAAAAPSGRPRVVLGVHRRVSARRPRVRGWAAGVGGEQCGGRRPRRPVRGTSPGVAGSRAAALAAGGVRRGA